MKYKMRILHYSKSGNAGSLAQAITEDQKAKCDKIPPAYPCAVSYTHLDVYKRQHQPLFSGSGGGGADPASRPVV